MFHFRKKEDYAFILIGKLVQNYKKRLVPLSEISKEYKISLPFLRNLANILKNNNIIHAVEGIKGGYSLAKEPQKIKVGDIIRCFSLDALFECCSSKDCSRKKICPPGFSWRKINKEFIEKIEKLSVSDFLNYK